MDKRSNKLDDLTDEEIAARLTNSLFSEADAAENAEGDSFAEEEPVNAEAEYDAPAPDTETDMPYEELNTPVPDAPDSADDALDRDGFEDDPAEGWNADDPDAYGAEPFGEADYAPDMPAVPQPRVEAFVPTEAFHNDAPRHRRKKHHRTKRNYAGLICVLLGLALLIGGGAYVLKMRYNPSSFFNGSAATPVTPAPTAETVEQTQILTAETPEPTPTPTLDPYAALVAQADTSMMQNIVNILIIGVDYAEERETWSGKKEWHSDVMMLLAVNFDENRADLISLPRDTYANIPGVKGIYKLNAAINCGGGMDAPGGAGFLKVCEAASWMLGGIPVNYYYAVTMPAVKGLVDAVGGVDYELETNFTMMGRRYYKGLRHLDGQGVLDYLRVRKNISKSGDVNRVNRQKRMMVALFDTMQQQNLILKIPDIISSFNGQLFTNCTLSQTAALASFAYTLDKENIGMYSMGSKGGGNTNIFNWNFCLTDQPGRVKIIKTVYGVDVPEEREYTPAYAKYRWAEMRADQYLTSCDKLLSYAADYIAHGELYTDPVVPIYPDGSDVVVDPGIGELPDPWDDGVGETGGIPDGGAIGMNGFRLVRFGFPLPVLSAAYTQTALDLYNSLNSQVRDFSDTRERAASEARKYRNGESSSFSSASSSFIGALDSLKDTATALAAELGYGSLSWGVRYEKDTSFNEVTVDFN